MKKSRYLIFAAALIAVLFIAGCAGSGEKACADMLTEFCTSDLGGRYTEYKAGMLLMLEDDVELQLMRYDAISEKYHSGVVAYMTDACADALRKSGDLTQFDNAAESRGCSVVPYDVKLAPADGGYGFTVYANVTLRDGSVIQTEQTGSLALEGGKVSELSFDGNLFEPLFGVE